MLQRFKCESRSDAASLEVHDAVICCGNGHGLCLSAGRPLGCESTPRPADPRSVAAWQRAGSAARSQPVLRPPGWPCGTFWARVPQNSDMSAAHSNEQAEGSTPLAVMGAVGGGKTGAVLNIARLEQERPGVPR